MHRTVIFIETEIVVAKLMQCNTCQINPTTFSAGWYTIEISCNTWLNYWLKHNSSVFYTCTRELCVSPQFCSLAIHAHNFFVPELQYNVTRVEFAINTHNFFLYQ